MPKREPLRDSQGRTFSEYVTDQVTAAMIGEGMSMREIAEASGIPRTRLGRHFNDGQSFTAEELAEIAQSLDLHPSELINAAGFEPASSRLS